MTSSLSELACFNYIDTIIPITHGLSSKCYQVIADDKVFFAKKITTKNESTASNLAAKQLLCPRVILNTPQWLISEYVEGENLSLSHHPLDEKILISIELMAQCHQLNAKVDKLKPEVVIHELIDKPYFSKPEQEQLIIQAKIILSTLSLTKNLVNCHGDLNFGNALIDQNNKAWLVDYECICTAPAEYDLAMFIAVNHISQCKINNIIAHYERLSPLLKINTEQLQHFLIFSHFINALWYKNSYLNNKNTELRILEEQHWEKFIFLTSH